MGKLVLTDPYISLDGTDVSSHIASISFGTVYDLVEVTQMGDIAKKMVGGLENNSLELEIQQDFDLGSIEAIIYPNRGLVINCVVKPTHDATSGTNPRYEFQALVSQWTPLNASTGSLSTASVNWPIYGTIAKYIT